MVDWTKVEPFVGTDEEIERRRRAMYQAQPAHADEVAAVYQHFFRTLCEAVGRLVADGRVAFVEDRSDHARIALAIGAETLAVVVDMADGVFTVAGSGGVRFKYLREAEGPRWWTKVTKGKRERIDSVIDDFDAVLLEWLANLGRK